LKKILLSAALLALVVPLAVAQADVVQTFDFQLKDIKPDGRFTVVFSSRSYDTTGAQPPLLTSNYIRLPAGAKLNKAFLNKRYYCDSAKLLSTLQAFPNTRVVFSKRLENLGATIKDLKSRHVDAKSLANAKVCKRAETGRGTVLVDARPLLDEPVPAKIFLYFGKATAPGGVASFRIIGVPDESSAVVRSNPTVMNTRVAVDPSNFINDPTSDGLYGYKLVLPAGPIGGLRISVAEVHVTNTGLTLTKKKKTCLKKKKGKCVKRKVKKTIVFWFNRPPCPSSGKYSFQSYYGYENGTSATKSIQIPCPNFGR